MNLVKRLSISLVALVAIVAGSKAQTMSADTIAIIRQIESSGNIHVSYPDGLYKILSGDNITETVKEEDEEPKNSTTSKSSTRVGYRIQVFDDNNVRTAQHEAQSRKRHIESRFPEYKVYTQFNSPYWRVKLETSAQDPKPKLPWLPYVRHFPAMAHSCVWYATELTKPVSL